MSRPGVHGLLNFCKPAGITSRDVVNAVCRFAGTGRVGHAGTLDPMATGVLVICVGWTTRLISCIQEQHKTYRAEFVLGQRSDTDDITGQVEDVAVDVPPDRETLAEVLARFVGTIEQVPPQYSAVKVRGRRAHQQARRGERVEIPPRQVEVFRLELLEYDFPRLTFELECGSGTYVRSIGRDVGEILGCGAVMSKLERTRIGVFDIASALEFKQLSSESLQRSLLPPTMAVAHLPRYVCSPGEMLEVAAGRPLFDMIPVPGSGGRRTGDSRVALLQPDGSLLALAEWEGKRLRPRQVFVGPSGC